MGNPCLGLAERAAAGGRGPAQAAAAGAGAHAARRAHQPARRSRRLSAVQVLTCLQLNTLNINSYPSPTGVSMRVFCHVVHRPAQGRRACRGTLLLTAAGALAYSAGPWHPGALGRREVPCRCMRDTSCSFSLQHALMHVITTKIACCNISSLGSGQRYGVHGSLQCGDSACAVQPPHRGARAAQQHAAGVCGLPSRAVSGAGREPGRGGRRRLRVAGAQRGRRV